MALFPSRPSIELYVPDPLFVGRAATFEVEITANDETKIESIDLRVRGRQGWRVGSGKSTVENEAAFPEELRGLAGPGTLAAGTKQRFTVPLMLPHGTAPSHALHPAWAKLELEIRVGIPWWPDAKATYFAHVRVPPPSEIVRTPAIGKSRVAAPDDARLEISLASTKLIAGEVLVGACAAFHMDDRKAREVDIELVPHLSLHRVGRVRERRAEALAVTVTLPAGSAGAAVPFQIALPEQMVPSFQSVTQGLSWYLVATTGSLFSGKTEVMMALEIFDRSAATTTPKLAAAPQLGDERVAALLARFALKHGWRQIPQRDGGDLAIAGEHGQSLLEIGYSYRGKDGAVLVARVHHPSLGLGLSVQPSGTLRHLFFEDLEVDIASWDRAHRATARSREQAIPFLKATVPSLREVGQLGKLVRWDDDLLVFEREVTDVDDKQLNDTRLLLQFVANAIEHERESIQPPSGLGVDVAAWRALAKRLDGELAIGELAIDGGRLGGEPVELGLVFDVNADPRELRLAVGATDTAGATLRGIAWKLARPASDVLGASVAPSIVDRVTRWPSNVVDLVIENGIARATLRLDGPRHPDEIGKLLEDLVAIRAELDPDRGPYR